jgi:hypothetical protein
MLLIDLPEESLCSVAQFLSPPDVLQFISIHPSFLPLLCRSKQFWSYMNRIHYGKNDDTYTVNQNEDDDWKSEKNIYLLESRCNTLQDVRWYSVNTSSERKRNAAIRCTSASERHFQYEPPSAREGHSSCIIGNYLVLTGGFSDDNDVYVKHLNHFDDGTSWKRLSLEHNRKSLDDRHLSKKWVYGATLTSLDRTRAIMFGGFQSGGYSNETAQVAILHLVESSDDDVAPKVWWDVMDCRLSDETTKSKCDDTNQSFVSIAGRAYHTATLLFNRYLFIVGGMQSRCSILNPILLDCHTWTWYLNGVTSCGTLTASTSETASANRSSVVPSARHGCSTIADMKSNRNRLVLFGGGTGTDLLRSGIDNTEVWELSLNNCCTASDVVSSMPWTWKMLHDDQTYLQVDEYNHDGDLNGASEASSDPNRLYSVERLNLGRCHGGFRVGRDAVLLIFGSRSPTTNSVLCYNLKADSFFRTRVHDSFIPLGRFTFAGTFVEGKGIIICHGGYTTQVNDVELSDTILLDLAPGTKFCGKGNDRLWLPLNSRAQSHPLISASTISTLRTARDEDSIFGSFYARLMDATTSEEQRRISREMISGLDEIELSNPLGRLLELFAVGQLWIDDEGTLISRGVDEEAENSIRMFFES